MVSLDSKARSFSYLAQFYKTPSSSRTQRTLLSSPIISYAAWIFNKENGSDTKAVHHANNLSAWLYGVKTGLVVKTRYSVNPDNIEISTFCNDWHLQFITSAMATTRTRAGGAVVVDNASVVSQLTNAISLQNKEAIESKQSPPQRNQKAD